MALVLFFRCCWKWQALTGAPHPATVCPTAVLRCGHGPASPLRLYPRKRDDESIWGLGPPLPPQSRPSAVPSRSSAAEPSCFASLAVGRRSAGQREAVRGSCHPFPTAPGGSDMAAPVGRKGEGRPFLPGAARRVEPGGPARAGRLPARAN